jgi:hypothetical protein
MWSAKRFRSQASKCATLAKQTPDEECRLRYMRLEQMYLHLAEENEQHQSARSERLLTRAKRKPQRNPDVKFIGPIGPLPSKVT